MKITFLRSEKVGNDGFLEWCLFLEWRLSREQPLPGDARAPENG